MPFTFEKLRVYQKAVDFTDTILTLHPPVDATTQARSRPIIRQCFHGLHG